MCCLVPKALLVGSLSRNPGPRVIKGFWDLVSSVSQSVQLQTDRESDKRLQPHPEASFEKTAEQAST